MDLYGSTKWTDALVLVVSTPIQDLGFGSHRWSVDWISLVRGRRNPSVGFVPHAGSRSLEHCSGGPSMECEPNLLGRDTDLDRSTDYDRSRLPTFANRNPNARRRNLANPDHVRIDLWIARLWFPDREKGQGPPALAFPSGAAMGAN